MEAERKAQQLEAELKAEQLEAERKEAERLEEERKEEERKAKQLEEERLEAERIEAKRLEAERLERERREAEKREQVKRQESERKETVEIGALDTDAGEGNQSSDSGCRHYFGYLGERDKGEGIPPECLECPKSLDCMLNNYKSKGSVAEIKKWYPFKF